MPVLLASRRRCRGVRARDLRADAAILIDRLAPGAELSVALVGDDEMRRLNRDYRQIDRPTDVLAFPMDAAGPEPMLGDVVISLDTAARQAAERGHSTAHEVRLLLVHGFLHLLGYDHERSAAEARRMFRVQRSLVAALAALGDRRRSTPTVKR